MMRDDERGGDAVARGLDAAATPGTPLIPGTAPAGREGREGSPAKASTRMALMPDDGLAHGALRQESVFNATLSTGQTLAGHPLRDGSAPESTTGTGLTAATHAGRQVSVSKGLGPLVGWFGGAKPLQFSRRALLAATLAAPAARAATTAQWFRTSDGVRLRYLEAGSGRTVVFVPGWCMPASIFQPQIDALSRRWRVVSLDPRGQGESEVPRGGYDPTRRGQDIRDLLTHLGGGRVVLAGWSLGVLDALSYADMAGDGRLAGLVLIDNSVGEGRAPPPRSVPSRFFINLRQRRDPTVRGFVASMYKTPQDAAYLDAIARQAQRMPVEASIRLLSYPRPREFWKQSLYAVRRPVYYAVTPRLRSQAELVAQNHPQPMVEVFDGAGHALFVDEAARFNASMEEFLSHRAAWS